MDEAPGRAQHVVGAQGYGVDRRRNADQRVDRRRLITLLDRQEFPSLGTGLWWALQTVTTVGYGDVTPATTAGRLVGAIFLLEALALMTVVTAVITSGFVEHRQQQRLAESEAAETVNLEYLAAQLLEVTSRLERIQRTLDSAAPRAEDTAPG